MLVAERIEEVDVERRKALRAFLMERRSRRKPREVGLEERRQRRVPGLRRDEVAEMIGVSVDWYRRFESGREIHISPQLVARIAQALQLGPRDEFELYCLAFSEIYRAVRALRGLPLHARCPDEAMVSVRLEVA